jgi:hopanoid C-3 methylase
MKILLVQPAPFENGRIGLENAVWLSEPVALTSIAAMVPEQHEVRILDMRLEEPDVLPRLLAEFRPGLLGVTSMTTDAYQAQAVCHCAKGILGDSVFTLLGGHHPTLAPEEHDLRVIDALCLGEGEETFEELIEHLAQGGASDELDAIDGLCFRRGTERVTTGKRSQARELDQFPAPARDLIARYEGCYYFGPATGLASIQTSRGCAFDCNFCAIWEFYERKVRFLSPQVIVDRMEAAPEKFVMFLDDNFLTHRGRIEELIDEIERRKVKKYWLIQGRTDFIADNPDLVRRMRDAGLMLVLSGYESNEEEALAALQKDNTAGNNLKASQILNDLGILTMGIFMVRPDFQPADFQGLYDEINRMGITIPMVVIHTPLPGTQSWRAMRDDLLTTDVRLFDLLHAVMPTALPREEFYREYARWNQATYPSAKRSLSLRFIARRPRLWWALMPGIKIFMQRVRLIRHTVDDYTSYLRDEDEIIGVARTPRIETKELVTSI